MNSGNHGYSVQGKAIQVPSCFVLIVVMNDSRERCNSSCDYIVCQLLEWYLLVSVLINAATTAFVDAQILVRECCCCDRFLSNIKIDIKKVWTHRSCGCYFSRRALKRLTYYLTTSKMPSCSRPLAFSIVSTTSSSCFILILLSSNTISLSF